MILTVGIGLGAGALPAVAATPVTAAVPFTFWDTPSPDQFDGLSTWVATFADPTAGAGQSVPVYSYFHEFGFGDGSGGDFGHISLDVLGGTKVATLTIFDDVERREHRVRVEFAWTGNSYYFLWVVRLAPGVWGGYAYSATTATFTFIGSVTVPTRLAQLSSESVTGVAWTGPDLDTCTAYPEAVVARRAPVGYHGATPVQTHFASRDNGVGDCPSTAALFATDWDYYVVGSVAPVSAAAMATRSVSAEGPAWGQRYLTHG